MVVFVSDLSASSNGVRPNSVAQTTRVLQDREGDCPLLAHPRSPLLAHLLRNRAFSPGTRSGGQNLVPYKCRVGNIRSCNIRTTAIP